MKSKGPNTLVVRQIVKKFVHSFSGDNNLVLFHLRWRETLLKREKVCNCFVQDCLEIFLLFPFSYYLFENAWNSKDDEFLVEKSTINRWRLVRLRSEPSSCLRKKQNKEKELFLKTASSQTSSWNTSSQKGF